LDLFKFHDDKNCISYETSFSQDYSTQIKDEIIKVSHRDL